MGKRSALIEHLANGGTIDRAGALTHFGIQSLTAEISRIRNAGWDVKAVTSLNANGQSYTVWSLPLNEVRRHILTGDLDLTSAGRVVITGLKAKA